MSSLELGEDDSHGYFVPMIDMLAGVIFILIIMLAAVSLVSRNDYPTTEKQKLINQISSELWKDSVGEQQVREVAQELGRSLSMQAEIDRISKELDRDRRLDATHIEPRRQARAALALLLQRLQKALSSQGIASEIFPDDGRLVISRPGIFAADGEALSADGVKVAGALAGALAAELPCLARNAAGSAACPAYRRARLDAAAVVVAGTGPAGREGESEARALTLLSAIGADRPALLTEAAVDGYRLLGYQAVAALPATASAGAALPGGDAEMPAGGSAPTAAAGVAAGRPAGVTPAANAASDVIGLVFKMNVPPIPAKFHETQR